jgi:peptide/nickel transport system substrate-binding protein
MRAVAVALATLAALAACRGGAAPEGATPTGARREQRLTTATISDPKTFNSLLAVDQPSASAVGDLSDGLVRLNPETLAVEPMLAERWEYSADGTVCTFYLRRDVRWHDGHPFTAADVAFTFDAIYDERVPNSMKYLLTLDGKRIKVEVVDAYTVRLVLPRPFAPLLNSIGEPILPKHILGASLQDGTFVQQWGIDTPPEKIIGTGPYRMVRYVPAQLIEYRRNPDYWMTDAAGARLPYLDAQVRLIVPNQDTMYLKFLAGQLDVHTPRPEEIADLRSKAAQMQIRVTEVGVETGSTFVTFNRNPRHYVKNGKTDPRLTWFTDPAFLRAIAHAVDKQAMIINCLNGYGQPAVAEISPENTLYHNPNLTDYAYDLDAARRLLAAAAYVDRDADGVIEDAAGNPVEFALHTNSGNQVREKMCSILKEDWTKLGMRVHYRPLDFTALIEKIDHTFEWDAVLIGFTGTTEPNNGANLLRSSGNLHVWNPSQATPATPWEAEIDRLLDEGSRELDVERRRAHYWRIQQILHEQLPMIQTVRQTQLVAHTNRLRNFRTTVWGLYRPELIRIAD